VYTSHLPSLSLGFVFIKISTPVQQLSRLQHDLGEIAKPWADSRKQLQGLSREEMHAVQGNLVAEDENGTSSPLSSPEFQDFDIAAVGLGFHHFDDPERAAARLVERLRPGGVLMILDFLAHDAMDPMHPASKTVMHHGFTEERIREVFVKAGAGKGFAVDDMGEVTFHRGEEKSFNRRLFMARGARE